MGNTEIMECLSKNYLETLANRSGFFNFQGKDLGTDLHISKANLIDRGTYKRLLTSGRQIHFQVKSVLEKYIRLETNFVCYDLEVKNFDDLIDRKKELGYTIPLVLIVFILPSEASDWITITPDELILRKRAYWYYPDTADSYTENEATQVIKIPKGNLVDDNFFSMIFNYFK